MTRGKKDRLECQSLKDNDIVDINTCFTEVKSESERFCFYSQCMTTKIQHTIFSIPGMHKNFDMSEKACLVAQL